MHALHPRGHSARRSTPQRTARTWPIRASVNGFRPQIKEIIYQIVDRALARAPGLWDLDGNEYVDALNGFGMNLFGWQPDFVQRRRATAARPGL